METSTYLISISLIPATFLVVFAMKYGAAVFGARARIAGDTAYQTLVERALAVQSENQASLAVIQAELSRVSASLASVEKILKQVE